MTQSETTTGFIIVPLLVGKIRLILLCACQQATFKHSFCPATNRLSANMTLSFDMFHISYNAGKADYGQATTAVVLEHNVYLILNGDHKTALAQIANQDGVQGCMAYFIEHIEQANVYSDHPFAAQPCDDDVFSMHSTALNVCGQDTLDRLAHAINAARSS